jgi:hypothetical protein
MVTHLEQRFVPNGIRITDDLGRFLTTASFGLVDDTETCTDPRLGPNCRTIATALQLAPGTVRHAFNKKKSATDRL